ncbi:MAG: hypothetical protein CMJ31_14935 [Phycisphaerae bacterium]|nr:hypothetical protein [Phycisphaerae bacterium]
MRIRTKLTILLVTFAVGPLVVVNVDAYLKTRHLGSRFADRTGVNERDRVQRAVAATAARAADAIESRRRVVEAMVAAIAERLSDRLIVDPTAVRQEPTTDVRTAAETRPSTPGGSAAPGLYYYRSSEGFAEPAMVWYDAPLFTAPDPTPTARQRLAPIGPLLRRLYEVGELAHSLEVADARGATLLYPAIALRPSDETTFEPPPLASSARFVWSSPQPHPVTGQLVVSCTLPTPGREDVAAGRATAYVLIADLLSMAAGIGDDVVGGEFLLLEFDKDAESLRAWRLNDSIGSSQPVLAAPPSVLPPESVEFVTDAMSTGRAGGSSRWSASFQSEEGLCSVRACGEGLALALLAPADTVSSRAFYAEEEVRSETAELLRFQLLVAALVFVIAVIVAYFAAKTVTRPVRRLAAMADRVASGDLSTPVVIKSGDELARLASDINAMIPKLAASVRSDEAGRLAQELHRTTAVEPPSPPPGYDVAAFSTRSDKSRGDILFWRGSETGETPSLTFAVGDVCGHGPSAVVLAASTRTLLRAQLAPDAPIGPALTQVNQQLAAEADEGRFVALVAVRLGDGVVGWSNAGHAPPRVYAADRDRFSELQGAGLPLGIDGESRYDTYEDAPLAPGGVLFVATDGLWEARNTSGESFGRERLEEVIGMVAMARSALER